MDRAVGRNDKPNVATMNYKEQESRKRVTLYTGNKQRNYHVKLGKFSLTAPQAKGSRDIPD